MTALPVWSPVSSTKLATTSSCVGCYRQGTSNRISASFSSRDRALIAASRFSARLWLLFAVLVNQFDGQATAGVERGGSSVVLLASTA